MTDFRKQLDEFHAKITRRAEAVVRAVVVQVGYTMVDRSPWGRWEQWKPSSQHSRPMPPYVPGLFKGSWDYGFDAPPGSQLDSVDMTGGTSLTRINAARTTPAFVTHFIVNNTEYAMAMEYGGAFHNIPSPMPPGGMVRLAEVEFQTTVGRLTRKLAKSVK